MSKEITAEEIHDLELQAPEYKFIAPDADAQPVSPIKRPIAKIQETASTFTLYDVYKMIGQLDRVIAEKEAEIVKHKQHKELFEAELALVEKSLGVKEMEKQYQVECLAETAVAEAMKGDTSEPTNAPAGS